MPIGYLVTTALVAWCTAFALWAPRPRRSSPSNAGYWFGFLVNELPFVAFAWLAASTALALAQGDLVTPVGIVGLAVAALASIGLGLVARRGLRARGALARALDEDLGIDPGPVAAPRRAASSGRSSFARATSSASRTSRTATRRRTASTSTATVRARPAGRC